MRIFGAVTEVLRMDIGLVILNSAPGIGSSCERTVFPLSWFSSGNPSSQSRNDTAVVELPLTPPPSPQLSSSPPRSPFTPSTAPLCSTVSPPTHPNAPSPAPLHCRVSPAAHEVISMRPASPPAVFEANLTPPSVAPPSPTPSTALPPSLASGEVLPSRRMPPELPATSSSRRCCMSPADAAAIVNLVAMMVLSPYLIQTPCESSRRLSTTKNKTWFENHLKKSRHCDLKH
ncbi:pectinesterase inhibitor 10-like [Penaeus monodon]|uniref:pectinesterase inhibitor 10-like n=1 Tax=Penaeus monodon TaxID=6687 RepID=UPI0018A6FD75|nr:pectinesterase inhibitor 10-like [Penaeus monodon]